MARRSGGVQVEGLRETVRALEGLGLEVADLKDAFGAVAAEGARDLEGRVAHDTGRLAASARGNRAKSKAVVTLGGATVPYAGPINYGWPARNITGSGALQQTDQHMQPVAVQRLEAEIDHQIRRKGLT